MSEWKDTTPVQSEIPVVPQAVTPLPCAPIFGFESALSIGDLPRRFAKTVKAIDNVAVPTTSVAIDFGASRYKFAVELTKVDGTCDVLIYRVDAGDTLVKTINGVSYNNNEIFVGGQDLINIDGKPVKVRVQNISGGCNVTVLAASN